MNTLFYIITLPLTNIFVVIFFIYFCISVSWKSAMYIVTKKLSNER